MKKLQLKHYKTMSTVCIKHLSMISRITFYTVVVRIVLRASKLLAFLIFYTEESREKVKGVKKNVASLIQTRISDTNMLTAVSRPPLSSF